MSIKSLQPTSSPRVVRQTAGPGCGAAAEFRLSARRTHADNEATREEQRVSPDHRRALHTVLAVSADACMLQTREARRITNRFARPAHSERDASRYFI